MTTKVVFKGEDRGLCLICAGRKYRQVEGQGIMEKASLKKPILTGN